MVDRLAAVDMKVKKNLHLVVAMLLLTFSVCLGQAGDERAGGQTSAEESAIKMEIAVWEAVKNKNADEFGKYLADDYQGVYGDGVASKAKETGAFFNVTLKSYSLYDTKVVFPQKDTAVITYRASTQNYVNRRIVSDIYYVSTVWVRRDDKWLVVLHAEVKSPAAVSPPRRVRTRAVRRRS